jgi:hypothetical protein
VGDDCLKIGDETPFGRVVYSSGGLNMVSGWEDYVFLYRRRTGHFSVKAYKYTESFKSPSRMVWVPIDSVLDVRTAKDLLSAIAKVQRSLNVYVEELDLLKVMDELDKDMAKSLRALVDE